MGQKVFGTTRKTGEYFKQVSTQNARPSTKKSKPGSLAVFGTSSQFKGIGRGKKGDPRK